MFKISLIACGNKLPSWVNEATNDYLRRLQDHVNFSLIEIPLVKRRKPNDLPRILEKEADLIKAAIPAGARVISMEIKGEAFSSEKLALKLNQLQQITPHICFLIGGPEGLPSSLSSSSSESWSLSCLTLPHGLARVILIESLYRAWAILHHHPYHK